MSTWLTQCTASCQVSHHSTVRQFMEEKAMLEWQLESKLKLNYIKILRKNMPQGYRASFGEKHWSKHNFVYMKTPQGIFKRMRSVRYQGTAVLCWNLRGAWLDYIRSYEDVTHLEKFCPQMLQILLNSKVILLKRRKNSSFKVPVIGKCQGFCKMAYLFNNILFSRCRKQNDTSEFLCEVKIKCENVIIAQIYILIHFVRCQFTHLR